MGTHWVYKEEILTLLAKAALASNQVQQRLLLDEAGVLLWRFDTETLPRTADEILPLLEVNIGSWLPKKINLNYDGQLLSNDRPTTLANTILADLSGDSLFIRDKLVSEVLKAESLENFRELINTYLFSSIVGREEIRSECVKSNFYTDIPSIQHNDYIFCCNCCGCPMDNKDLFVQCESPFCYSPRYSLIPPHDPIPYKTKFKRLRKVPYDEQLTLSPLAWRTIASPLVFEKVIAKYLKKVLPELSSSTIEFCKDRPGVTLFESGRRITLEPVATYSETTIINYYSKLEISDETWIVVPGGTALLFRYLKAALPDNYKVVTAQSYPYEYLAEFHKDLQRRPTRVRCR